MSRTAERCRVCSLERETGSSYCPAHGHAMKNLRQGYNLWSRAYGSIPVNEYLSRLSKLSETGAQVQEVIRHLERNPDEWTHEGGASV